MADPEGDIVEAALWWDETNKQFWKTRRRLLNWVGDKGPIPLPGGRLFGYLPDGNSWDPVGVAEVMPQLIKNAELILDGPKEVIERALDIILEEFPDITWNVEMTVDAVAANRVIKGGGEAADKLIKHRVAKNKLGAK